MGRGYIRPLAVVALPVLIVTGCGTGSESAVRTAADPREAIVGTWYPLEIDGYQVPEASESTYPDAYLEFGADGDWSGSDGCNGIGGSYRIEVDGSFAAQAGPQTEIGCANVPSAAVLVSAQTVEIVDGTLEFTGPNGAGRYTRSPNPVPTGPGGPITPSDSTTSLPTTARTEPSGSSGTVSIGTDSAPTGRSRPVDSGADPVGDHLPVPDHRVSVPVGWSRASVPPPP